MSGLVLKLGPGERVLINGAVIENGNLLAFTFKPATPAISEGEIVIMRLSDASTRLMRLSLPRLKNPITTQILCLISRIDLLGFKHQVQRLI
jgi:flagellar biosynthesis regulator FlbT